MLDYYFIPVLFIVFLVMLFLSYYLDDSFFTILGAVILILLGLYISTEGFSWDDGDSLGSTAVYGEIYNFTDGAGWSVTVGAMPNQTDFLGQRQIVELQGLECGLNQGITCDSSNLTVPVSGVYQVDWDMTFRGAAIPHNWTASVLVNNITNTHWTRCLSSQNSAVVASWWNMAGGCLLNLNANDRLSLGVYHEVEDNTIIAIRQTNMRVTKVT